MTTIAYDHKRGEIAVDGRSTAGSVIFCEESVKWHEHDGAIWFMAGAFADFKRFLDWHTGKKSGKPEHSVDCSALVVIDGACHLAGLTDEGEAWTQTLDANRAIGSGSIFALASMDHGKRAHEAVAYAATRDIYTGGKITRFDLKTMKFKVK